MLVRAILMLLAGLAGALVGAALLAMASAAVSKTLFDIYRQAAIGGGFAGAILGFTGGAWAITFQGGRFAGSAVTWLWVTAFMIAGCLAFVAFS